MHKYVGVSLSHMGLDEWSDTPCSHMWEVMFTHGNVRTKAYYILGEKLW